MKALLMRSFNPAEIVEVMKVDHELIEKAKKKDIELSKTLNDEVDVKQILTYKEGLILHEDLKQKTKDFDAVQVIDVFLKEGDVLIKTHAGYQKNVMPIKFITDKEERLIEKFNLVGK